MPSMKTFKQLNAISGLAFAVFLVMHFLCHYSLTLGGWDAANSNLKRFRVMYQNPVFEILLLLSVLVHGYANVNMKLIRDKLTASANKKTDEATVTPAVGTPGSREYQGHRIAGYVIGLSLLGHVAATRIVPSFALPDPSAYDYGFVAVANDLFPLHFFLVYLSIFGIAAGWHSIYGTWSAVNTLRGNSVTGKEVPLPLKVLALSSHVLIVSAALAIGGFYYNIDKTSKSDLYDKVNKSMGLR